MTRPVDLRGRLGACDPGTLMSLSAGFVMSSVLHAAVEVRLFATLGEAPIDVTSLATILAVSRRGLERLLGALGPLGLVERVDDHRWRATSLAARHLHPSAPLARLLVQQKRQLYPLFMQLGEAVRTGAPQPLPWDDSGAELYASLAARPEEQALFLEAMNAASIGVGDVIASQVDVRKMSRIVDLGGGGGQVAVELLRAAPELHVDLVDFPAACALAAQTAHAARVGPRLGAHAGDLLGAMPPLPPADAVLLSGVLGDFDAPGRKRVLAVARDLVKPRGLILISETLLDDDRRGPLLPALLALNMLLATRGGDNFTGGEIVHMLAEAGFVDGQVHRNGDKGVRDLVVARRRG